MPKTIRRPQPASIADEFDVAGAHVREIDPTPSRVIPQDITHADSVVVEDDFPESFAAAVALLQDLEANMPQVTRQQQRERHRKLSALRQHVHTMQQGMPVIHDTHAANIVRQRQFIEDLAERL